MLWKCSVVIFWQHYCITLIWFLSHSRESFVFLYKSGFVLKATWHRTFVAGRTQRWSSNTSFELLNVWQQISRIFCRLGLIWRFPGVSSADVVIDGFWYLAYWVIYSEVDWWFYKPHACTHTGEYPGTCCLIRFCWHREMDQGQTLNRWSSWFDSQRNIRCPDVTLVARRHHSTTSSVPTDTFH